jgi:hypothetical protein
MDQSLNPTKRGKKMKYFEKTKNPRQKSQVNIGDRFGSLVVCSDTYYTEPSGTGKHRRQKVDCKCDCGKIREFINCSCFKKGGIHLYCSITCPIYIETIPQNVPEDSKLCKIGEKYNYLTVISDTFYEKLKGEANRHKCVKVRCDCGKEKTYREDKVFKGAYKSCGCVWEYTGKKRSWNYIKRTYDLTEEQYKELLQSQNNSCAICGSDHNKTTKSEYMFVDHCHDSGKVRGLLCSPCNSALGSFEDNIKFLENAIEYLKKHDKP